MSDYGPAPHGVRWEEADFQTLCRLARSTVEALVGYAGARWVSDPCGMQSYLEWLDA